LVSPFDIITPLHNAFRRDIGGLDQAVYEIAKNGGDIAPLLERLQAVGSYLRIHAGGEDDVLFPALEAVAPNVAKAFSLDHRELDSLTEDSEKVMTASNELEASRGMAGLWTHLRIHLDKEDGFLYPLVREVIPADQHGPVTGKMSAGIPHETMPSLIAWFMANTTHDERETTARVWQMLMPEQIFGVVKGMIQASLTNDDWADLTKRIPGL
jgi:iron-sulfur cluster repair protein YtfE (RIC family)